MAFLVLLLNVSVEAQICTR